MWPPSQRTPWLFSSWCGGGSSCRWDCSLSSCSRPGSWQAGGSAYFASGFTDPEDDLRAPSGTAPPRDRPGAWAGSAPPKPALAAEVQVDRIPELLGEMERCPPGSDDPAGVHSWKHAGVAQSGSASDL